MSEKHTCSTPIWSRYNLRAQSCSKVAAYEHDGKWYCKLHHPPTIEAKNEALYAKWKAKNNEAVRDIVARRHADAELHRKAAAYDRLVAWLDYLESMGVAGRFVAPREIREVIEKEGDK